MQKVTIKAYAIKHKLSIFNVMKMVKSKKLKSVSVEENGKEQIYICIDEAIEKEVKEGIVSDSEYDVKRMGKEIFLLKKEVEKLKTEFRALLKKIS